MSGSSASLPCSPPRWLSALVLGVAALAFLPTLGGGFLGDDFVYVSRFRELPWSEWPRLFVQDWSGGVWGTPLRELRPFAALSFMSDARMFGGSAFGYRLTNLALHLVATLGVVRLAWRYGAANTSAALIAGLVFALHPAHAEAVAWITGRVDLLATAAALMFWLGAEMFAANGRAGHAALAGTALALGMFSKELCLFAPPVLLLRWLLLDFRAARPVWLRRLAIVLIAAVVFTVYAFCRRAAFPQDAVSFNVWADAPTWHRQAAYAGWILPVLPFLGQAQWKSPPSLELLHGVWLAFAVVAALGFVFTRVRGSRLAANAWFFGGLWYFAVVFPLVTIGYFSARHLYFPTIGFALAAGFLCATWRGGRVLGAVFVTWVALAHVWAVLPWQRNGTISRAAIAAIDRELTTAGPGAIVLIAVPEMRRAAWLWAWASPQCVRAPFVSVPAAHVIERQVNYSRSDHYFAERKPLETVRTATTAIALFVDDDGNIFCRRVPPAELQQRAETLAPVVAHGLSPEAWTDWVKSLAQP